MRKIFTFFGISIAMLGANSSLAQDQLDNNGFENWENEVVKDTLDFWFTTNFGFDPSMSTVSRLEEGFSGKAVLLETLESPDEDITAGGIILAQELGEDLPVGYPYDSDVTTINAHLKYDIADSDTGFVLVILTADGVPFSFDQFPIYGTQEDWDAFSWDLSSPILTPDAVTIAFFSSGYDDSEGVEGSWMAVDNVFFGNDGDIPTPLPNFSFESWSEQELEVSVDWYSLDPILEGFFGFHNVYKSTDAAAGDYSVLIETYDINVEEEIIPFVSNGEFDFEIEDIVGGTPFTSSPMLFKGQYKFISDEDDTASVYLRFWNEEGDFEEYADTLLPTDDWTEFSIDIDLDFTPDSVLTVLMGGGYEDAQINYDDVRFVYDDVSVPELSPISLEVYPNPANENVNIRLNETVDIVITDMAGKAVHTEIQVNNLLEINTGNWDNGIYLVQVYKGNSFETKRLIVQH